MELVNDSSAQLREYATSVVRRLDESVSFVLPLTVEGDSVLDDRQLLEYCWVHNRSVETYFRLFPYHSVLLGAPGAGKSFAIKSHAVSQAIQLLDSAEFLTVETLAIPIHVDLKLYQGSFADLLLSVLPPQLLERSIENQAAQFLVDSFNEAPREYLESGKLAADLQSWIARTPKCRWTITSRTNEGLDFFVGQRFLLAEIDEGFVSERLRERNIDLGQRHFYDLLKLLRKPIFFSALMNKRLQLQPGGTHPAQAIESMLASFEFDIWSEFQFTLDLSKALGELATSAVASGNELMKVQDLIRAIRESLDRRCPMTTVSSIVERLRLAGLLLAYDNDRIALYHQSITELIAARHVAAKLRSDMGTLNILLGSTRWDQSLHLVTHYLDKSETVEFFRRIIAKDMQLAVSCARFGEFDRHEIVDVILEVLLQTASNHTCETTLFWPIRTLPVDSLHELKLRQMLKSDSWLCEAAVPLLYRAIGEAAVDPVIAAVFDRPMDHNLGQTAGEVLANVLEEGHIDEIFRLANSCHYSLGNHFIIHSGVTQFITNGFSHLSTQTVIFKFLQHPRPSELLIASICSWAGNTHSFEGRKLLIELLSRGSLEAVLPLFLDAKYHYGMFEIADLFERRHNLCLSTMEYGMHIDEYDFVYFDNVEKKCFTKRVDAHGLWTFELVNELAGLSPVCSNWVSQIVDRTAGTIRLMFLSIIPERRKEFWEQAERLFLESPRHFEKWECNLLGLLKELVDWSEKSQLLMRIIDRRNTNLTLALIEVMDTIEGIELSWPWLKGLLPWLEDVDYQPKSLNRFPAVVARYLTSESRRQMIDEFNNSETPHRDTLAELLLVHVEITISMLTEESVEFLIERMRRVDVGGIRDRNLLAKIATEELVERHLLPLLNDSDDSFRKNITVVLQSAGERHRRRYV